MMGFPLKTGWWLLYCLLQTTGVQAKAGEQNDKDSIRIYDSVITPIDKNATKETVALYNNLKKLTKKGIMFGHQDDLAYGVDWRYVPGKSDVKEVVGDYPAVYGWDLGRIEHGDKYNLDSVPFDKMRQFIQEGYERGGVITISWHADNPFTGGNSWDTTAETVRAILPGGSHFALYLSWLDKAADFLKSLKGKKGEFIPILFRPFHELTGNWFWWGRNKCTPDEFRILWQITLDYFMNEKGLHHLLYVYNTAGFTYAGNFLDRYPGDDQADLLSFDAYQYKDSEKDSSFLVDLNNRIAIIVRMAQSRGKIAALAETGYEQIPYAHWWTNTLWKAIGHHPISYMLVWRNHGRQRNGHWHYYVPKKADVSTEDFIQFYKLDRTLFQKDVRTEHLYQLQQTH